MSNRYFKITNLSLRNKTTVFILTALLTLFGIFSYKSMPKSLYPDIVMPTIMVQTVYPGNSPADIENLITRPLEKEIKSVKGLKKLTSTYLPNIFFPMLALTKYFFRPNITSQ